MERNKFQESIWRRAWADAEAIRHSTLFFWGAEVVGGSGFGAIGAAVTPGDASRWVDILYPAIGVIIGFTVVFLLILLWKLIRALFHQRNEARNELIKLTAQDINITQKIDHRLLYLEVTNTGGQPCCYAATMKLVRHLEEGERRNYQRSDYYL